MAIKGGPRINTENLIFLVDSYEPTSYAGAGNTWADLVNETSYDATLSGAGFANNVISLDGSNDYVSIPGALTSGVSSLTIMGWSKFTEDTFPYPEDMTIVNKDDGSSNRIFNLSMRMGKLRAELQGQVTTDNVIRRGSWFHWAQTTDSNGTVLYLNGLVEASGAGTLTSDYSQPILVGKNYDDSEFFQGNTAVIAVYDRALASGEIYQNYKSSKGRFTPEALTPYDPDKFCFEVDTTLGDGSNTVGYKMNNVGDLHADWGDDNITTTNTYYNDNRHTYSSPGTYVVQIEGQNALNFDGYSTNGNDKQKVTKIYSFGENGAATRSMFRVGHGFSNIRQLPDTLPTNTTSIQEAFVGCTGLDQNLSNWDVSQCTNMASLFYNCKNFNNGGSPDINNWDMSNVTDISQMFMICNNFNQPIGNWNTSNVTKWNSMFYDCRSFDQDIGSWDLSNLDSSQVIGMYRATNFNNGGSSSISGWNIGNAYSIQFYECQKFNQPIGYWDTSNVTSLFRAFYSSINFNNGGSSSISGWDTSNVTTMYQTFYNCQKFNQPVGDWNTSNVTDMYQIFNTCYEFNHPLDNWDTSSVTNMRYMFGNCRKFDQDIGHFDLSSNTNPLDSMFYYCHEFNNGGSPSISGWNTTNNTSLYMTFNQCYKFDQPVGFWDTSNVTNMQQTFTSNVLFNNGGYDSISGWDTSNVTTMYQTFYNCQKFNQPIGNWNTSSVTNMYQMLNTCYKFNQPLDNWNTSNVTNIRYMFGNCMKFDQNIGHFNLDSLSNGPQLDGMFYYCYEFNNGGSPSISGWNTSSNTSLDKTFYNCYKFDQPVGFWDTSNVTNMQQTFTSNVLFNNGGYNSISGWDTSNVTTMYQTFYNCQKFNQPIGDWNTSNVTNMYQMLSTCFEFNQPLNNWNTSSVTNMRYMFGNCRKFDQNIGHFDLSNNTNPLDSMFYFCHEFNNGGSSSISGWDTSNNTSLYYTFYNCYRFNQPIGSWNTSNVTNMQQTFVNCVNFDQNLSNWNLASLNASNALYLFMLYCTLSTGNYDALLNGWNSNKLASANGVANWRTDLSPHFGSSKYTSAGSAARQALINYGWTITDGGLQT